MTTGGGQITAADSGLITLATLLRFLGISADPEQIRHRFGGTPIGIPEMLRVAGEFGLKARARKTAWSRLPNSPLPAIAALKDGGFMFLGKAGEDKVLVQSPSSPRPALMTQAEFEAVWDGRLVFMTRRAGLLDLSRRFDITWFLGAIHKYRRLLAEVLVASFFLQLFALVSPLFFQVVIDKVLVHRSLSTLDVLVIGLLAISVFETIRNFLTSSALTLVIDLFFTFVFLAVMFFYSPLLTAIVFGSFPFYIAISAAATPLFRRRLNEKFQRGAENQAFLVESVTGIETLKAMAVEPQMQRRWEE